MRPLRLFFLLALGCGSVSFSLGCCCGLACGSFSGLSLFPFCLASAFPLFVGFLLLFTLNGLSPLPCLLVRLKLCGRSLRFKGFLLRCCFVLLALGSFRLLPGLLLRRRLFFALSFTRRSSSLQRLFALGLLLFALGGLGLALGLFFGLLLFVFCLAFRLVERGSEKEPALEWLQIPQDKITLSFAFLPLLCISSFPSICRPPCCSS